MIGTAAIEAALLSALIWVAIDFMLESANEAINKRAMTTSQLFASATKDAVLSYDLASLETFADELLTNPDIRYVKILDAERQILTFAGDEQFLQHEFIADSDVSLIEDGVFDAKAMIKESDVEFGSVELGIDIGSINQALTKVKNFIVSIAVFEMLLVAIFSYVLGIYLTTNLYRLRDSTNQITANIKNEDYNFELETIHSRDELEQLSEAFTDLTQTLVSEHERKQMAEQELIELNYTLEDKVERRTEKLKAKNLELENLNHELAETQEQLVQSEKMASVGQLAAGVAHEINNPIGFVTSNLETLTVYVDEYIEASELVVNYINERDKQKRLELGKQMIRHFKETDFTYLAEDSKAIFSESTSGLQRVSEIVKNLKQFSRADTEQMQECNINDCIETALKMVNNELKYHCEINTKLSELPPVIANMGKLIQVFTNILINSGQAIDNAEAGQIQITTSTNERTVNINISDNGKGIPEDIIDKIFNPFFTTKPVGQGTGLGLSICYDIIQEHHGDISVQSSETHGTSFIIVLPVFQPDSGVTREID